MASTDLQRPLTRSAKNDLRRRAIAAGAKQAQKRKPKRFRRVSTKNMERSSLAEKNEEWIKMDDRKDNPSKKQSRFQVAKVDFAVEKHSDGESSNGEDDDLDQDGDGQPDGQSWNACSYDTHNVRSLRHYTREALPRMDHYRNIMSVHGHMERPTLDELHDATLTLMPDQKFGALV
ncbi:hypothetical protein HPB52_021154 [Rhipicephalus sanguineus]|uniref:Amino acid permease N-terminal domain-containing protein n=1 Tax=Rhipicephalus sanguineus TaxID=34632 RepID=A0A9D4Q3L9_RHISA|nr:hypothetical protein HPB52_021154 [Rhipicephalus sanguineus]